MTEHLTTGRDNETTYDLALAAGVLALIYADSAPALGRDDLVEKADTVHESRTSR